MAFVGRCWLYGDYQENDDGDDDDNDDDVDHRVANFLLHKTLLLTSHCRSAWGTLFASAGFICDIPVHSLSSFSSFVFLLKISFDV